MATPFEKTARYEADLLGYSARHELRLLVEVKAGQYWADADLTIWTDEQWHSFFEELTSTLFPALADYFFLLATPHQLALWLPGASPYHAPDYVVPATAVLAERIDMQRFPLKTLDAQQLEGTVHDWLLLTQFTSADKLLANAVQSWVVQSGLHTAIYRGDITQQAA